MQIFYRVIHINGTIPVPTYRTVGNAERKKKGLRRYKNNTKLRFMPTKKRKENTHIGRCDDTVRYGTVLCSTYVPAHKSRYAQNEM